MAVKQEGAEIPVYLPPSSFLVSLDLSNDDTLLISS